MRNTHTFNDAIHFEANRSVNKTHYKITHMQYTAIFHGCKNNNFQLKLFDYFHIFAQNIYCGYTLEPSH